MPSSTRGSASECTTMDEESALDEECLALESIFEDKFSRLQPDKIRLVISAEGAEDEAHGGYLRLQPKHHSTRRNILLITQA